MGCMYCTQQENKDNDTPFFISPFLSQPESSLNRVAQWTSHCAAQSALKARADQPSKIMLNGHKSPWHVPKPKLNWWAGSLVCQLAHLMPDSSRVNQWGALRPWPAHKRWGDSFSTVLHVVSHASFRLAKRGFLVKFLNIKLGRSAMDRTTK